MKKGLLIIYSGPSGVGKGTVLAKILNDPELNLTFSISMTTRKPRVGETHGVNYFFVERDEFDKAVKEDKLLEHAEFVGNCYGTPRDYVEEQRNLGKNVILEIDLQGAKQVMEKCSDATSIFILPTSLEELENRIRGRATETEEVIQKRLSMAQSEIDASVLYKYRIVNDDVDRAASELKSVILKEMSK